MCCFCDAIITFLKYTLDVHSRSDDLAVPKAFSVYCVGYSEKPESSPCAEGSKIQRFLCEESLRF